VGKKRTDNGLLKKETFKFCTLYPGLRPEDCFELYDTKVNFTCQNKERIYTASERIASPLIKYDRKRLKDRCRF
jgi:hypothetical protein